MQITIPTAEELSDRLGGLDRLLTAKRWERAAIVYAFTRNGGQGGDRRANPESGAFPVPVSHFAALGYSGLEKEDTVARYRRAWQWAVDEGRAAPTEPGQEITLPDLDWSQRPDKWPPRHTPPDVEAERQRELAEARERAEQAERAAAGDVARAIKTSPAVAKAAREAVREADLTHKARQEEHFAEHGERYDDQRRRDEKRKTEDPLLRGLEQQQAVRDLGSALMHTRRDTHQRAEEIADALRRMGDVGQDAWQPGLLTSLSEDLRHAEEGIAALLAQVEQVKRHRDTGMTDLDAGLTELLGGGEQS